MIQLRSVLLAIGSTVFAACLMACGGDDTGGGGGDDDGDSDGSGGSSSQSSGNGGSQASSGGGSDPSTTTSTSSGPQNECSSAFDCPEIVCACAGGETTGFACLEFSDGSSVCADESNCVDSSFCD
jgi:hypothetical protein